MRPVRLLSLALAVGLVAAGSAAASAATATGPTAAVPAAGSSTSALTVLTLSAAGTELRAGVLELLAETLADPSASATVTPLLAGGTPYGRQTVSSGGGPTSVPAQDSAALVPALAGLVSATTPAFAASAATTPSSATSQVGSTGLGAVELLGLPVDLEGTVAAVSTVTGTGSTGEQVLEVTGLELPSVADLLAALGVDLSALPVEVLYELLDELDLLTTTVTGLKAQLDAAVAPLQSQIDDAQDAVDDAAAALLAEQAKLAPAQAELAAATAALAPLQQTATTTKATADAALAELTTALGGNTLEQYLGSATLRALLGPVVEPALATYTSAKAAADKAAADLLAAKSVEDAARAVVAAVQAAIDTAQDLLDAALDALDAVLASVLPQITALLGAVTAVLDGTPLLSLDSLEVATRTSVTSATEGGQTAEVIGGQVSGLRVLGTDVLDDVLGVTSVDLLDLTATQLGAVNGVVDTLTGTLSSVLSTVPGFPTLSIPAPQVELLRKTTETGVVDGFGTARAGVELLTVSLPAITLPLALQLPDAASLPVFGGVLPAGTVRASAVGDLLSTPVSLGIGSLGPQASFRPAVAATGTPTTGTPTTGTPTTGTPTTGTPIAGAPVPVRRNLPRTGPEALVAVAGLALLGAAAALRRRRELPEL